MKYIITETQYKELVGRKKANKIADQILNEINRAKKNLNESVARNLTGDILKKYKRKGLLSEAVVKILGKNKIKVNF